MNSSRFPPQPSAALSDESVVEALRQTRLWPHFRSRTSTTHSRHHTCTVLGSSMSSLPKMSTGQAQMFSLARAVLQLQVVNGTCSSTLSSTDAQLNRPRIMPILLLDEATSSLDPETEAAMNHIIHSEFTAKGHTSIAITHRTNAPSGTAESVRAAQDIMVFHM